MIFALTKLLKCNNHGVLYFVEHFLSYINWNWYINCNNINYVFYAETFLIHNIERNWKQTFNTFIHTYFHIYYHRYMLYLDNQWWISLHNYNGSGRPYLLVLHSYLLKMESIHLVFLGGHKLPTCIIISQLITPSDKNARLF